MIETLFEVAHEKNWTVMKVKRLTPNSSKVLIKRESVPREDISFSTHLYNHDLNYFFLGEYDLTEEQAKKRYKKMK